MRYTTSPTSFLEWIAVKTGRIPYPVVDVMIPQVQARALHAAVETGVLGALAEATATAPELARRRAVDAECLVLVLRVVQAMGYVALEGDRWSLTAMGARHFGKDAPEPYEAFVRYGPVQWRMIDRLGEVLRSGQGIAFHDHHTAEEWALYQGAMVENALGFAWFVADNLPVPAGAKTCLDVAGAHGRVGAELCSRHPPMRNIVFDRREALETARTLAERGGWSDLVEFREGDLLSGGFGTGHDVVLLCNILHHFSASTNQETLRRLLGALAPGGTIGIFDIEPPEPTAPPEAAGDAAALFFRITSTSTCFRGDEYVGWLEEAGFQGAKVVRSVKMPSRLLVHARRPL